MRKERKHYTAQEKVAILKRHLLDKVPVSDLCEELSLKPTVFYRWQKEFFENGAAAFQAQERPYHQVDFVRRWSEKTEIGVGRFIHWLGVAASKFYDWRRRYGCVNEHNGLGSPRFLVGVGEGSDH